MVTSSKRQEFRIKLQKLARRRAEKKIESLEDERQLRLKELCSLRELCLNKGASENDVSACKPRKKGTLHKMDTSFGLSSIASLSLDLSMSISVGGPVLPQRVAILADRRDTTPALPFLGFLGSRRRSSIAFVIPSTPAVAAPFVMDKLEEEGPDSDVDTDGNSADCNDIGSLCKRKTGDDGYQAIQNGPNIAQESVDLIHNSDDADRFKAVDNCVIISPIITDSFGAGAENTGTHLLQNTQNNDCHASGVIRQMAVDMPTNKEWVSEHSLQQSTDQSVEINLGELGVEEDTYLSSDSESQNDETTSL